MASLAKRATDILFMENYLGTSLGVVIGIVLYGVAQAIYLSQPTWRFLGACHIWLCEAIGILPFAIVTYRRRQRLPPAIELALAEIRNSQRAGAISDAQAHQLTRQLLEKVICDVVLQSAIHEQAQLLQRSFEPANGSGLDSRSK
jgi:hypothetical protein